MKVSWKFPSWSLAYYPINIHIQGALRGTTTHTTPYSTSAFPRRQQTAPFKLEKYLFNLQEVKVFTIMSEHDGSSPVSPSETSPLLHGAAARNGGGKASEGAPPEATLASTELKVILTTSFPLICAFLMEQSFTVVTIFSVGHIGKVELSATSIASLTANITGYAVCQGVASCLDTLCPSAYGSGNKKLVGLHFQRTTLFLLLVCIPIAVMWLNSAAILSHFMKQENVIKMAGLYLQILVLGLPGYASFECGKRFMIAQGLFVPTMWILGFCAPLNCFLNWLFVWVSWSELLYQM
jgi:hypothetical protein